MADCRDASPADLDCTACAGSSSHSMASGDESKRSGCVPAFSTDRRSSDENVCLPDVEQGEALAIMGSERMRTRRNAIISMEEKWAATSYAAPRTWTWTFCFSDKELSTFEIRFWCVYLSQAFRFVLKEYLLNNVFDDDSIWAMLDCKNLLHVEVSAWISMNCDSFIRKRRILFSMYMCQLREIITIAMNYWLLGILVVDLCLYLHVWRTISGGAHTKY